MTVITKEMFSGLVGANAALINDVVNILNDSRFTFAEPLRQLLSQGKYTLRTERAGDVISPSDGAVFIDPRFVSGVLTPGQIVVKSSSIAQNGPFSAIGFIEILFHEGLGHGNEVKIGDRLKAFTDLTSSNSPFTPTQRGDKYVQAWLDDEASARYQSYLALTQMEQLNLWEPGRVKAVLQGNPLFMQFRLLESEATRKNLTGDDRTSFMIERARPIMAEYNNGTYTDSGTKVVLTQLGYVPGTLQAAQFQAYIKNIYGGVRFTPSDLVMHDDGSFSSGVVFANGNTTDLVFDASGHLFRRTETIVGNADTGRATIITTYTSDSNQPDRIEVKETDATGRVSSTYIQDAAGSWRPTSWTQDGQTYTGDDLATFIANLENASNASDAAANQNATTGRLNQALASASGDNVAGVTSARDSGATLDTLATRMGMPYVSDRWAPAFLSGQVSSQLLLLNTAGALTSQGLAQIAQSRINSLQSQPSVFTVTPIGTGAGFSLPLVLDLGDDGLDLVSMDRSNASFDANANGNAQTVGWVGPKDGILVLDKNRNGIVDSAAEWFGQKFAVSGTPPANQDGFKALATLANAGATVLSAATSRVNAATGKRYFDELQVWIDADQDGQTDAGELRSLASLGITSIDLSPQAVNRPVNGNTVLSKAGYSTADGKRHTVSDVGLATELPVFQDGMRPVSAAALAFAEYAGKGYAAMATGQARAIAASIQGLPAAEQAAIDALRSKFVLPTGTGFDAASFEARGKMSWAQQAGLPITGLNDKIAYFIGPAGGDRATIPVSSRIINTVPTDIIDVLSGIGALRSGEVTTANAIATAASGQSDAQTKAQLANATQSASARTNAATAARTAMSAWNSAIVGYLDIKDRLDGMAARLPAIQAKLNAVVPQNQNLTGHLANSATFLTRADASLAAEAFRAYSAILQPMAALKVTGDQLLSAIAQSNGYTQAYVGQTGQTITVGNGYNLLLGNRGSQTFVLGAGVDNIAVTSTTGDITVSGFQTGAKGDRVQFMSDSSGFVSIRSYDGNTVLTYGDRKVTLLGVNLATLDLFANLSGVGGASFEDAGGVRSLRGAEVFDGQVHVTTLYASRSTGDTLIGGERGSRLHGDTGDDTFVVTGRDYQITGGGGWDTVSYAQSGVGVSLNQTYSSWFEDGQTVTSVDGRDNLGNSLTDVSNFIGSNFNDVLRTSGERGSSKITGGKGNDLLAGGAGGDTYVFAVGDGIDTIEEVADLSSESDLISFGAGILAADVKVTRMGEDLVLAYGTDDSITVKRWFGANPQGIVQVRFADSTVWDRAKVTSLVNAPTVKNPLVAQSATEDAAWTFVLPADTFAAKDGAILAFNATLANGEALPSWLHFNAITRTFTGTPLNANVGSLVLKVIATDPAGGNASTALAVNIANTNDAPTAGTPLTVQTVAGGVLWRYTLPASLFADVDAGDKLTYSVKRSDGSALPNWLSFDAATRTLSGNAGSADAGNIDLKITATDIAGASANQTLQLVVTAPVLGQIFTGTTGNDFLVGTIGNDTLNGAQGADRMTGGAGNDIYYVDNTGDVVIELANEGVDTVMSTLPTTSYVLAANVENLIVNRASTARDSADISGNALDNTLDVDMGGMMGTAHLRGGDGNDTLRVRTGNFNRLYGGAGNDTLEGAASGDDYLTGGAGSDTFLFARGAGKDVIVMDTAEEVVGDVDTIQFGAGVSVEQLWFRLSGETLEVSIIGTSDTISTRMQNVEKFRTSDGKILLESQVQNLAQAMASFAPPAAGQTTLPPNYQSSLAPVLAANWH